MEFRRVNSLKGVITVPGDKSISHRGIMLGAISKGKTHITGFLDGADCRSTLHCFKKLGVEIEQHGYEVVINGKGMYGLTEAYGSLDMGNSGTTTRLISGILSAQPFRSRLKGDDSLSQRPMKRVMEPLSLMGATITSDNGNGCLPITITGHGLQPISYNTPVASAQVKSAILLAGLYAPGVTSVTEPALSRNHTELMLKSFGAEIETEGLTVSVKGNADLRGREVEVPGDISSAAFFMVAGLISSHGDVTIKNVNINPTRAGIIEVVRAMGGKIELSNVRTVCGEDIADIHVETSSLHGTEISGDIIPTLIDEIPVIAVMAACAVGKTVIKDASELRVKESDRITAISENLKAMGADVTPTADGMIINGGEPLHGAMIKTYGDHRIAMAFAVASLVAESEVIMDHPRCVDISYPRFYETLEELKEN